MADITELAQREKFEAWWERTQHNGNAPLFGWSHWRDGEGYKVDDDDSELDGMWSAWKAAGAELVEALDKSEKTSEARREAIDRTHNMFVRERNRANAAEEALEKAKKSNEFLKGQLSELANFNPDWDKLEASYESWREIAAELLVAKERIAELEEAERKLCAANVTLDARAEQAERERENWRTSFDNERFRADKLKAHIDEMTEERTASINELSRIIQKEVKAKREAEKRIAELEREYENLRPVGVMSEKAYHRLENRESRFIALWPRPEIYLPRKRPEDGVLVYARTSFVAANKAEAE